MKTKLGPLSVLAILRELRRGPGDRRPIGVAGARELVPLLARALREGGDASAVVEHRTDGIAALVWVGAPDEGVLRAAARADVPIVAVTDEVTVPYVLATDLIRVRPGTGFPVDEITRSLARRLGEGGTTLAARLPVLRPAVCDWLIASFSRRNGLTGALVRGSAADLPILITRQIRLVLRIAVAHGEDVGAHHAAELGAVVGAGFGLRSIARELLELVPRAGWAVRGGVAYSGTRAIGEAAVRYFEARS